MAVARPFAAAAPPIVLQTLAGRPGPDDIDSALGLHGYTMLLSMHSSRLEVFHNCFYKVSTPKETTFGSVSILRSSVLDRSAPEGGDARSKAPSTSPSKTYEAKVANFEVIAPHESGSQIPFPCLRLPQLAFQTMAFKSVLPDIVFMDVTVFDEHSRVFWGASALIKFEGGASPHTSALAARRFAEVDFDREAAAAGAGPRWGCLAEHGAAQLVVQLESGRSTTGEEAPPRLNAVTWHPEVAFLDAWWGSHYAARK